jgi:hypothetical protein
MTGDIDPLKIGARRQAIDSHPNLHEEQPDGGPKAVEFTHYDCWFLPPDEEYTFDHLEEAMRSTPGDVAAECERIFSGWMETLDIPAPAAGWFSSLFMRGYNEFAQHTGVKDERAGWAGIIEASTPAAPAAHPTGTSRA